MIHRAPGAAPEVRLSGGAAQAATALGVTAWQLSISQCRRNSDGQPFSHWGRKLKRAAPDRWTGPER